MQPMNYTLDVKQPFENALSGVQAGIGLNNAIDQEAVRTQDMAQKKVALQQQQQMQADLGVLSQKPNPTAQDFAQITTKYPALAEHFKNTWSMLNSDQQQTRLGQATQVYAALNANKPEVAKDLLTQQRDAFTNSGQAQDAQSADTMLKLIDLHPDVARNSAGLMLSSVLGPEKFATTFSTLAKLPSDIAQGEATASKTGAEAKKTVYEANNTPERLALENRYKGAEIRNLDSQIGERSGRLGLDRDKLQSETELKLYELNQKTNPALNLGGDATKIIHDSTVASVAADQSANQMLNLAGQLDKADAFTGAAGAAAEWLKKTTGNQDAMTALRQEYTRMRSSQVSKMLPPGAASDKDIALAMAGFPPDNADPKQMGGFLRGMAKLSQYSAATENAKAEWVNAVGHLGKPRTDITVDGVNVPAGSTFTDFARQYMDKKVSQKSAEAAQSQIPNRSYMRFAQPAVGAAAPGQMGSGTFQVPGQ